MGLFVQRPEEPAAWAGIPSEPARPETAAERLTDAAPVAPGLSLGPQPGGIESVVVPLEPSLAAEKPQGDAAED